MPHHAAGSATEGPRTEGRVIRWARWYDLSSWLMSFGQEPGIRRDTIKAAAIQEGESVLDVGCGTGTLTLAAKRRAGAGQVCGIDASAEMIEVARGKAAKGGREVDFRVALIEEIPYPDESFDVVLSSLMLHHLPDDLKGKGFEEMRRVLKPGGRLLAVDLSGSKGVLGVVMRLVGHRFEEDYVDRLAAMAAEAGFGDVETGPLRMSLAYVRGTKGGGGDEER